MFLFINICSFLHIGITNTVTPSHSICNPNNLPNILSINANHKELIDDCCTRKLFKYYATLIYKHQHKINQLKKFENYVLNENDNDSPTFLKIYDPQNFKLPPLPNSISNQQRAELLTNCKELLKKTKDSLLTTFTSIYHTDSNQHLELIKSFNTYETVVQRQ